MFISTVGHLKIGPRAKEFILFFTITLKCLLNTCRTLSYFSRMSKCIRNIFLVKVLIKCVYFYWGDIWRLAPELKNSFFLLCDIIITVLVLGPKTRWSVKISFPTVAVVVSSLVIEALCYNEGCWLNVVDLHSRLIKL